MQRYAKWLYYILPLVVLLLGLSFLIREPQVVQGLRLAVFDTYQRLQPREYTPLPVTVIDVDERSLRKLGQWPWPRTLVARLIGRLDEAGVLAVGLDILLSEPDRTSPRQIVPLWPNSDIVTRLRAQLDELPDHDKILAAQFASAPVVGGMVLTPEQGQRAPVIKFDVETSGGDPVPYLPQFGGVISNLPELDATMTGLGSFNLIADADGQTRKLHLFYSAADKLVPSFAAELLRVAQRAERYEVRVGDAEDEGIASVKIGELLLPTDGQGRLWLHFTRTEAARSLSAWRVLEDDFDLSSLREHIVIIGTSAAGLKDLRSTPLDRAAAGVTLHAALIEQALLGEFLYRPGWAESMEYLYAAVLAVVLLVLLKRLGAIGSALVGGITVLFAVGLSWVSYVQWHWLLDPVLPSLAALAVYLLATMINYLRIEVERRHVRDAFGHYLAPAVIDQLTSNPGMLRLGGEKRETTFLFTDVAGFTALTETLEPNALVDVLNAYLDETCRIVLDHGGTIDKIVGDALHVMFNAPSEQADHARRAVRCAIELDKFCQRFVQEQVSQGIAMGITRIGVNTGMTVVGNFGGAARFDYTAHGDAINTAARLESVNKYLGTRLCVSETTKAGCRGITFRPVAELLLVGKSAPLAVFEPIYEPVDAAYFEAYEDAYQMMRRDDSVGALAKFEDLLQRNPLDPLVRLHIERLQAGEQGVVIVMAQK